MQRLVAAQTATNATMLAAVDLDRDRSISQIEAVLFLYGRQRQARQHLPAAFGILDADDDHAISRVEMATFLGRDVHAGFSVAERQPSLRGGQRSASGGALGSSVGVSGSAYAFFGSQQAYIQDYDVVNGQYDPVIGIIGSGVLLEVSGIVVTIHRGGR